MGPQNFERIKLFTHTHTHIQKRERDLEFKGSRLFEGFNSFEVIFLGLGGGLRPSFHPQRHYSFFFFFPTFYYLLVSVGLAASVCMCVGERERQRDRALQFQWQRTYQKVVKSGNNGGKRWVQTLAFRVRPTHIPYVNYSKTQLSCSCIRTEPNPHIPHNNQSKIF